MDMPNRDLKENVNFTIERVHNCRGTHPANMSTHTDACKYCFVVLIKSTICHKVFMFDCKVSVLFIICIL